MGYNRIAASAPRDLTMRFCPRKCRQILSKHFLEDFPDNLLQSLSVHFSRRRDLLWFVQKVPLVVRLFAPRIVKSSKPLDSSPGRM